MALRGDRHEFQTNIQFFSDAEMEKGGIVSAKTSGSGAALDQGVHIAEYRANPSGANPVGLLLQDVKDYDLTRMKVNPYKNEVQVDGKVALLKKGYVVTNMIYPGHTPVLGGPAYVGHSGLIAASDVANDAGNPASSRVIGTWGSTKDEDGFAQVNVDIA